jgi:hypothetical protein
MTGYASLVANAEYHRDLAYAEQVRADRMVYQLADAEREIALLQAEIATLRAEAAALERRIATMRKPPQSVPQTTHHRVYSRRCA